MQATPASCHHTTSIARSVRSTCAQVGKATVFDFGEWKSEVAFRHNPDGSVSFITTDPGVNGYEFVVGSGSIRTLVLRDAQHEYVFDGPQGSDHAPIER